MARKKDNLIAFKIIVALLVLGSFAIVYQILLTTPTPIQLPSLEEIAELSTDGYVEVAPEAVLAENLGIVALSGDCYRVVANTDPTQAISIINGIEGTVAIRPNTHDLMKEIFDTLGIEVLMVKVVDLKDNNYIGRIVVKQGNNILNLDSKPSDGIALALRTNSTIYFKETLLKERGEKIC